MTDCEKEFIPCPKCNGTGFNPTSEWMACQMCGGFKIIVKFKEGVFSAAERELNESLDSSVIYTSAYWGFKILQISEGKTVAEMVEAYSELPDVEYAEPNYVGHWTFIPNDPYYSGQWHFDQINLEAAWDLDTTAPNYGGDPSIIVAVLDSGVAYETYDVYVQAPDLANTNFWVNPGEIAGNCNNCPPGHGIF